MANKIQVKRSAVPSKVPTTSDLDLGEIAINTYDGIAYIKKDNGTQSIVPVGNGDVNGPSSATDNALARFDSTTGKLIQNSVGILSDTGSLSGITNIQNINYVDFETGYSTTITTGQLGWDSTNNALAFGMAGGNIIQHIGEDQYLYIKASSAITKGQVIMFTGSVGASGILTGAPATGITDGTYIMGIAAESISLNGFGFVQTFGVLTNVDTSAFSDGNILWYNPSVTGGLTATKPSAPNVKVQVAACNKGGSSGGGVITVRVNPGSQLGGTDSNVQITSASNGQLLSYDGVAGYWKNTSLTAGTGISVSATAGVVTVTNSAPDQTVAITGTAPISVTGTYPNFTASISQSTTSSNGYLSSTDWNTFNGKQAALVSGTNIKTVNGTSLLGSGDVGTIGISYGGTGQTTASAGFNALSPITSTGDLIIGNGSNSATRLAIGSNGYVLTSNGTTASWQASTGGVTSFSAGTTGFTPSTGTTGAVTLSGTLNVANGGTGLTSVTAGYVPYGNGTSALSTSSNFTYASSTLTAPNVVASNGMVVNSQTVSANYSIPSGSNAMAAGPITVSSGITVTIPSGSRWVIL